MRGQILSIDMLYSILGIILGVGLLALFILINNTSTNMGEELFRMRSHEVSILLFSSDPIVGILDKDGYLITDINTLRIKIGVLEDLSRLKLSLKIASSSGNYEINQCNYRVHQISFKRYLMNRSGELHNVTLIIC